MQLLLKLEVMKPHEKCQISWKFWLNFIFVLIVLVDDNPLKLEDLFCGERKFSQIRQTIKVRLTNFADIFFND